MLFATTIASSNYFENSMMFDKILPETRGKTWGGCLLGASCVLLGASWVPFPINDQTNSKIAWGFTLGSYCVCILTHVGLTRHIYPSEWWISMVGDAANGVEAIRVLDAGKWLAGKDNERHRKGRWRIVHVHGKRLVYGILVAGHWSGVFFPSRFFNVRASPYHFSRQMQNTKHLQQFLSK